MANNDMIDSSRNPNLAPQSTRKPLTNAALTDQQRLEQQRLETGTIQEQRIPIVEESLQVGKREIETGGVRVESRVVERPVHEQVNLREEHVHVERKAVDRPVQPGDMAFREGTIELRERAEEAVVAKQARVVEEVIVGKEVGQRTQQINETLRHTEVSVDRFGGTLKTTAFKPFESFDSDFRKDYETNYARLGGDYNRYAPLYRYGYNLATAKQFAGKDWNGIETEARGAWEEHNPGTWEQVKAAVRHGWDRVTGKI